MTPDEARTAIAGVWQLVEYRDRFAVEDPWLLTYGTHPVGVLQYHPDGFLSVQISPATDAPLGIDYLAYFGTYTVREANQDGERISGVAEHHMAAASDPALLDESPDRPFTLTRDELIIGDGRTSIRRFARLA